MVSYVKRQPGGWQVQVPGRGSKLYSDSKHGGKAAARAKAARHAQQLADRSRVNPDTGRRVGDPAKAEGVARIIKTVKAGEKVYRYPFWVAFGNPNAKGKQKQLAFSVSKYGEKEAKAKARRERARMVKQVLG